MNPKRSRPQLIIFFILIFLFTSQSECLRRVKRIVGGIEAAKPPEDDPVVFVNENDRNSRVYGSRDPDKGFYVFKGIRFGEPPTGHNRFQRPRAVHLEGEYNATSWGPPCPQEQNGKIIGSEDCLFLNIFTPALPDSEDGYPVLIWIHGGGFRLGAASQYEMRNLIKKKTVVVSIQYRLGSLGFLSTGTRELPGNNGMFDMTLAISWVKMYIGYFGGNPNRIIAFGHGTGAASALMLSLSKLTNSFFSGLIAMSGSMLSNFIIDRDPMNTTKYIASKHSCPIDNVHEMVQCLQELPIEKLISEDSKLAKMKTVAQGFISGIATLLGPGPVIDGSDDARSLPNFMTDTPENFLSLGKFPKIPLLSGIINDETGGAILGEYKEEVTEKLKLIPDYLNKQLISSLQETIPFFGNGSKQFVFEAFGKYLNIDKSMNGVPSLKKIAESLNDAIFNAPAFLTANYWSKRAETFFYSFDHKGGRSRGKDFLSGLPVVDARKSQSGTLGHGDDLGYIFGANDFQGRKLPESSGSPDDDEVTETFTDMIAQFARTGKPFATDNPESKTSLIPSFSSDDNSFISIAKKATPMKNFRFCEMGLWTGAVERLDSGMCSIFKVTTETVERFQKGTKQITNILSSPIDITGNIGEKIIPESIPTVPSVDSVIPKKIPGVPKIVPKIPRIGFFN